MVAPELQTINDGFSVYANPKADLETRFIYKEIFEDGCYDVLGSGDDNDNDGDDAAAPFFVDAGGNIGMFSLWARKRYPASRVLAFEPAPDTMAAFRLNMAHHGVAEGVEAHQCGLGAADSSGVLTFYGNLPGNSTLHPEEKEGLRDLVDAEHPVLKLMESSVEKVDVDVRRLSGFLAGVPGLSRVDLLKVDVEGAELDVLAGIDDDHWALIRNVAMEIQEVRGAGGPGGGKLDEARRVLGSKGFANIKVEAAEWAPKEAQIYMLVAKRK